MTDEARPTGPEIRSMMARFAIQHTELAARMGTSRPTISHWLGSGYIPPKQLSRMLAALAELLDERADATAREIRAMRASAQACREDARLSDTI